MAMATSDDVFRLQELLPDLAGAVYRAALAQCGETGWLAVILDARYSGDDPGPLSKVRVEMCDGSLESANLASEDQLLLLNLGEIRCMNTERWYGIWLRVTVGGECESTFNYDPNYAADDDFFET
jgi:hypothetical protein